MKESLSYPINAKEILGAQAFNKVDRWRKRDDFMRLLPSIGNYTPHISELRIPSNMLSTAYSRGWAKIATVESWGRRILRGTTG